MANEVPTTEGWVHAAARLGVGVAEIKAVMRVEAAGHFFDSDGGVVSRFEPHHIPEARWGDIGFFPAGRAPWRASLRLGAAARVDMADRAGRVVGGEAALRATSMGAPQIMGFNHALCGYESATDMWSDFHRSADRQLAAFVSFLIASDLDGALRAHDWRSFAAGYNGAANVDVYAPRLEAAFERESGGLRSPRILRLGAQGDLVIELQDALTKVGVFNGAVDGVFGPATLDAVRGFQAKAGLKVDGVVGFRTWNLLPGASSAPDKQPTVKEADNAERIQSAKTILPALLGTGGIGAVLSDLDGSAQTIIVSAICLAALGSLAVWSAPHIRRAFRPRARGEVRP